MSGRNNYVVGLLAYKIRCHEKESIFIEYQIAPNQQPPFLLMLRGQVRIILMLVRLVTKTLGPTNEILHNWKQVYSKRV